MFWLYICVAVAAPEATCTYEDESSVYWVSVSLVLCSLHVVAAEVGLWIRTLSLVCFYAVANFQDTRQDWRVGGMLGSHQIKWESHTNLPLPQFSGQDWVAWDFLAVTSGTNNLTPLMVRKYHHIYISCYFNGLKQYLQNVILNVQ